MGKTKLILLASLSLLLSCAKQEPQKKQGCGSLSLGVDISEKTKAALSEADLLSNAKVKIYYADFSGLVRSYVYSEIDGEIVLPAASYRVDVIAGEAAKASPVRAGWEHKSYKGSKEFRIDAGLSTKVRVEAGVSNAISKISFDSSVAENFAPGYTLTISTEPGDELTYGEDRSGKEGYFIIDPRQEPSFIWTFTGTLLQGGTVVSKSGTIPDIKPATVYDLTLKYTVKNGTSGFEVFVDYSTQIISDVIVFEPVSTGLSASDAHEIWAGHATLHADVDESEYSDPSKIGFKYAPEGSSSWSHVSAERVEEGVYRAVITSLTPSTTYSYALEIDSEQIGDRLQFTTQDAPQLPNAGFEVYKKGAESNNYYSFYDPANVSAQLQKKWWDSGNAGSTTIGSSYAICEPSTTDKKVGNASAHLISRNVIIKFAAGNLFAGHFGEVIGTSGGTVYFGRPFQGRPTAARFWIKYSTSTIDCVSNPPSSAGIVNGKTYDTGTVYFAIGTWSSRTYGGDKDSPILIDTTHPEKFVTLKTLPETIAYGEIVLQGDASNSHNKWQQVTIPFDYSNLTAQPTHIVFSAAASKWGDYFTGCSSSQLFLDEIELLYE